MISMSFSFNFFDFIRLSSDNVSLSIGVINMCGTKGGGGGDTGSAPPPPPGKSQNKGFLSNTGPDPMKNHKAT